MLTRLIYISLSVLPQHTVPQAVRAITDTSVVRNTSLSVTGALLHTGTHFSQVLEGTSDNLDMLMSSIRADERHKDLLVVDYRPVDTRMFAAWSMVYLGQAQYVQGMLSDCLARADDPMVRTKLLHLFREFARA